MRKCHPLLVFYFSYGNFTFTMEAESFGTSRSEYETLVADKVTIKLTSIAAAVFKIAELRLEARCLLFLS